MRKTINRIIALVLSICMLMSVCIFISGCDEGGTDPYIADKTVYSNGGSVVVYDGYVYYINGVPNYTDKFGKTNNGNAVKGALYRAKITDYRNASQDLTDSVTLDEGTNIRGLEVVSDFEYEAFSPIQLGRYTIGSETEPARIEKTDEDGKKVRDENGNPVMIQNVIPTDYSWEYRVKSEPVIKKKIGNYGYRGGIYIFDGKIYFATPCNKKNSSGEYDYEKTEFYSYDIESKAMNLLYTTEEANTEVPYVFYKQHGTVYLLTFEHYYDNAYDESYNIKTGFLISNAIENGKVIKKRIIEKGLDEVHFPSVETYDPNLEKDRNFIRANDFIYYTKLIKKDQTKSSDSNANTYTLGMISPDGSFTSVIADRLNRQPSIKGVSGDYFYYVTESLAGKKELKFTNLLAQYKQMIGDSTVVTVKEGLKDMYSTEHTLIPDMSKYTDVVLMSDDEDYDSGTPEDIAIIAYSGDTIYRITANETKMIWTGGEFQVMDYKNGKIYGLTGSFVASISAFSSIDEDSNISLLNVGINTSYRYAESNWNLDFFPVKFKTNYNGNPNYETTEWYVGYMAGYTEKATHYMVISKAYGIYSGCCLELCEMLNEEKTPIKCYDERCINWYHDHSSWDSLETLTEEEKEQIEANKKAEELDASDSLPSDLV